MSNVGYATLTVIPSAKGFKNALGKETDGAMRQGGKRGGVLMGGAIGGALMKVAGPMAAAFSAAAVGGFVKGAVQGAANLEQSIGAVDAIFKGSASQIHKWADTAATDVGLTKNEFNELGSLIGAQLKNGGLAMDQLAPKTNDLIKLGADLSSMFGGTTADAVGALSSALKGERDPIERYGVSLKQATIDAKAAEMGFKKVGGSLSNEAQQAATLALIMEQTKDAHGNFARETDTLAHKQQVLSALWEDGKAKIGQAFLPAVSAVTGVLVNGLSPALDGVSKGLDWLGKAVGAVWDLLVKGDFTKAFREIFGVEEDAPIVGTLFDIRDAVTGFFDTVKKGAGALFDLLFKGDFTKAFREVFGVDEDAPIVGMLFDIRDAVIGFFDLLKNNSGTVSGVFDTLRNAVATIAPHVLSVVKTFATALWPVLQNVATFVIGTVVPVFSAIVGIIRDHVIPMVVSMAGYWADVLAPKIAEVVSVVAQNLSPVLQAVQGFIVGSLIPAVQQIVAKFHEWQPAIMKVISVVVSIIGWVLKLASAILGKVLPPIIKFAGFLLKNVVSAILTVIGWIGKIIGFLWNLGAAVVNGVKRFGEFARGAVSKVGEVLTAVKEMPKKALVALGSMATTLLQKGKDLIQGFIDGIKRKAGDVISAIKSAITDKLPQFVKDALKIKSPSRVFMSIGEHTAAGMAVGIRKGARDVQRAADGLVPSAPAFGSPDVEAGGVRGARAAGGPLIGSLTLQSNGNVREDLEETLFHVRRIARGGVYA